MVVLPGRSGQATASAVLDSLRAAVLVKLIDGVAIGSVSTCALLLYQSRARWGADIWWLSALTLGVVLQRLFHARLGFRSSAALLLLQMAAISSYLLTSGRFTAGTALLHVMLVLSTTVFFGRRAGLWALGFCLAALVVGAAAALSGYARPSDPEYWNPTRGVVWLRYASILTIYGGALALSFSHIIAGLESSIARAQGALLREQEERARREAIQAALERSQRAEALGELAAGIAHDFNNSLTVILASSELMRMSPGVTEEISQLAADINQVARTAASTARQLLGLGRNEERRTEHIAVAEFVRAAEGQVRHLLRANIACTVEVRTSTSIVAAPSELRQSLFNLAINARDAMPEGGQFAISVGDSEVPEPPAGWCAKGGRYAVISCRDTGTGIDALTLERIFEPFFTTKAHGKGTGLGLAMVRRAVYDVGGYVTVESTLGAGTTVHLYLPVAAHA